VLAPIRDMALHDALASAFAIANEFGAPVSYGAVGNSAASPTSKLSNQ